MAAGKYDVSTTAMQSSAGRIVDNAAQMKSELNQLLGQLAALEGQWRGEGKQAFDEARGRYENAAQRLSMALDETGALVRQNHAQYTGDDSQARSAVGSASSGMDVSIPGLA